MTAAVINMSKNNEKVLSPIGVTLILMIVVGSSELPGRAEQSTDPWAKLNERTAWIMLGDLDASSGSWATLLAYHIVRSHVPSDPRIGPDPIQWTS
jgi:hypothetical protein